MSGAYSRGQAYIFCLALDTHKQPHQALTDDLTDHCSFIEEETKALATNTHTLGKSYLTVTGRRQKRERSSRYLD